MRKTLLLLLIITGLLPKISFTQIYIEPLAGYQLDLNNHNRNKLFNTGVQLAIRMKKYEFLMQFQKSWPQTSNYTDSSFTLNPNLPLYAPAAKTIRPSLYSLSVGNRIKLAGRKTNNSLFAKISLGIMYQRIAVAYHYDKINYIILNPDKAQHTAGPFVSAGLEYMYQIKRSRIFAELNFSSPPGGSSSGYPNSFNLVAPVSLNIGYSIQLSKK